MNEAIIEIIKDRFIGAGVKQKENGIIVTYFTPDSATEFTEGLTTDIGNLIATSKHNYLEQFVLRVKPLLNTVTSQETLQIMYEAFIKEETNAEPRQ